MKLLVRCQQIQQMLMGAEGYNVSVFVTNRDEKDGPMVNFLAHRKGGTPLASYFTLQHNYDETKKEITAIYKKLQDRKLI